MQEEWKDVIGFEDCFKVSNLGAVYSKRSSRVLKQHITKAGYRTIGTRVGGQTYCLKVHRLVADAFLEAPSEALVNRCAEQGYGVVIVRHLDNDKLNCKVGNLAWGTYKDNSDDFALTGLRKDGSDKMNGVRHSSAKLTQDDARRIRQLYVPSCHTYGQRSLARMFGVDRVSVSRILRDIAYKEQGE